MNDQPSILVVDDDEGIRRTLEMILAKKNYHAVTAVDGKTALAMAQERFFNLALLDIRLPDIAGPDLLAQLKSVHPDLEVLIITGHATLESAIQALSGGAYHYFIKPLNVDELLVTLEKALDKQRLVIENRQLLQAIQTELEERKHAEEALAAERNLLRTVIDNLPDRVFAKDTECRFILNNLAHVQALGAKSQDEVIGKTDFDFRPPDRAARALVDDQQVLRTGSALPERERSTLSPSGEKRWSLAIKVPLRDKQGEIIGLVGISRDITERKRAEEALRVSEERFRIAAQSASDLIWEWDIVSGKLEWFGDIDALLGYAPGEFPRTIEAWERVIHFEDYDRVMATLDQHRKTHAPYDEQYRVRRKDGRLGYWTDRGIALWDEQGNPYKMVGVCADITERKRAEETLAAERNLLRTVIDNLPDRIYVKDAASRFLLNNPAHLQALGAKSQEEASGKTDMDLRPPEMAEQYSADDRQVLESGESLVNREERTILPNGARGWLLTTKIPLRDPQGNVVRLVGISRDITARKRAEERVSRIAECFLNFGPDVLDNINRLTALCGELLEADCALYNRLDEGLLCSWGQWHVPPGYNPKDTPEGHLCHDVIQSAREQVLVIRHLSETPYAQTDPNVLPYRLQTYIGRAVKLGEEYVGSLCVVYQRDVEPSVEDQQVMGVIASAIAVEETRRRSENAQRAAEADYRSLFENVPDGVYRSTPDGQFLAINPALVLLLGYASAEELLSIDNVAALYADPAKRALWVAQLLQTGEIRNVEATLRRKDGRQIVVLDNARVVRDARGDVVYFEGTLTDITERKQHERELLAVATVSAALRAAPTRGEMLPVILDQVQTLLNADAASIITRDPITGDAMVEVGCGIWSGGPEFRVPSGQGISGRVFETARPYVTNDLRSNPYYYWPDQISYLTAMAMVPLIVQGGVIGALAIGRVTPITSEELSILAAIADISANALHRAALHEKTEQHVQRLVALRTVDQTINASLDLRFTLNIVLDQIVAQLRVDAAAVLLHNPAFQTLDYAAGRGFRTKGVERRAWRIGEGYAGAVALERRVVTIRNLAQSGERESAAALAGEGFVSYCGVPLIAKGKIKGVLEIFQRTPLRADAEWLNFLEMLAGQAAIAIDNAQLIEDLQRAHSNLVLSYDATIEGWSRALDLRDQETEGHAQRVIELTEQLARAVGVSEANLIHIRRGALLHDIGKIGVPDHILWKPAALTEEEWVIMRHHPEFAHDLLKPIPYLHAALDIPYCHHEKWDGTGYPRGLTGEAIPLAARIFALVDVWDALRSERPYRAAWPEEKAREYLREQSGKQFDPKLLERFLKIVR